MLSAKVKKKLDSMTDLPSIPVVITSILSEIENENYSAKHVASLMEKDQGLVAKLLKVANSPLYGLTKTISTIDLAIVILGSNVIREILISLLLQKLFRKIDSKIFDIKEFWKYSMFCGSAARFLARKFKYKLVSEAFIAGLMHDIGILILMDKFKNNFAKVRKLQENSGYTLIEAELEIFECTHCDVGAWLAERWNFPDKIIKTLEFHHTPFFIADEENYEDEFVFKPTFSKLKYPLTAIVSMAEWLSYECDMKKWDAENTQHSYYIGDEFIMNLVDDEFLKAESALAILKQGAMDEYEKSAAILSI
jgi:HD-like signal output (HDOD) protein